MNEAQVAKGVANFWIYKKSMEKESNTRHGYRKADLFSHWGKRGRFASNPVSMNSPFIPTLLINIKLNRKQG